MRIAALSLLVCAAAALLEGLAAGRDVKRRFTELSLPRFSPPFGIWVVIGLLYYTTCWLILQRLLTASLTTAPRALALVVLVSVMVANAGWTYLFFRLRNLRASFVAFLPYSALVLILAGILSRVDRAAATILVPYLLYLVYATWWGYSCWRLNTPRPERAA